MNTRALRKATLLAAANVLTASPVLDMDIAIAMRLVPDRLTEKEKKQIADAVQEVVDLLRAKGSPEESAAQKEKKRAAAQKREDERPHEHFCPHCSEVFDCRLDCDYEEVNKRVRLGGSEVCNACEAKGLTHPGRMERDPPTHAERAAAAQAKEPPRDEDDDTRGWTP